MKKIALLIAVFSLSVFGTRSLMADAIVAAPFVPIESRTLARCEATAEKITTTGNFRYSSPGWKRIFVRAGNFSIEMPYAEEWTDSTGKILLPYTPVAKTALARLASPNTQYLSRLIAGSMGESAVKKDTAKITGITFGANALPGLCHASISAPFEQEASQFRKYAVWWQNGTLKEVAPLMLNYPVISLKVGKYDAVIVRQESLVGECGEPEEYLYVQRGKRLFGIHSLCRPIGIDHLRIANSIQEGK